MPGPRWRSQNLRIPSAGAGRPARAGRTGDLLLARGLLELPLLELAQGLPAERDLPDGGSLLRVFGLFHRALLAKGGIEMNAPTLEECPRRPIVTRFKRGRRSLPGGPAVSPPVSDFKVDRQDVVHLDRLAFQARRLEAPLSDRFESRVLHGGT